MEIRGAGKYKGQFFTCIIQTCDTDPKLRYIHLQQFKGQKKTARDRTGKVVKKPEQTIQLIVTPESLDRLIHYAKRQNQEAGRSEVTPLHKTNLLTWITKHPGLSLRQICQKFGGRTKSTIERVKKMERLGKIERTENEDGRKGYFYVPRSSR